MCREPRRVLAMLVRAIGVPIDRYSHEQIELLRDFVPVLKQSRGADGQPLAIDCYAIDISFDAITDPQERRCFRDPCEERRAEHRAGGPVA